MQVLTRSDADTIEGQKIFERKKNMRNSVKPLVSGNLAMAIEPERKKYSTADKEAYLANATEVSGVKYCTLPVEILKIDTYQRPVQKKVREIAVNWDPAKAGAIKVSYRDGEFWVVDGQNRMEAAKMAGVSILYCQVSTKKSRQEEAWDFIRQGEGVVLMSSFDIFNAMVVAGDKNALIVERLSKTYGVRCRKGKRSTAPIFGGMSAIMDACDRHGEAGVEWILSTIKQLGWHNDRKAYSNAIVRALSNVYGSHSDKAKARDELVRNVDGKKHNPQETIIRAMSERPSRGETIALTQFFESLITCP